MGIGSVGVLECLCCYFEIHEHVESSDNGDGSDDFYMEVFVFGRVSEV